MPQAVTTIGGFPVEVIRKPIKHLYLRVKAPGRVVISAPKRCSQQAINDVLAQRHDWIIAKQQQWAEQVRQRQQAQREQESLGPSLLFEGQRYPMTVNAEASNNSVTLQNEVITVNIKPTPNNGVEKVTERWYRQQLTEKIEQLLLTWQPIMAVAASGFGIRKMKTRWGSCNIVSKKIWLNLELVKVHPQCLEYVVVHELTHLYERYHNARFYRLMDQFLPDWKERRHRLNYQQPI